MRAACDGGSLGAWEEFQGVGRTLLLIFHVDIVHISKQVIKLLKFKIMCTMSTWHMRSMVLHCYIGPRSYIIYFRTWVGFSFI
jgi:hypothetical protein